MNIYSYQFLICITFFHRFSVAIKSAKSLSPKKKGKTNHPRKNENSTTNSNENENHVDPDLDLLMDEAKTMFSIGGYHENIVNLQGIGYEADFVNGRLSQVSNQKTYHISPPLRDILVK